MGGSSVVSTGGGSSTSSKRQGKRKSKHLTGSSGRSKKIKSKKSTSSVVDDSHDSGSGSDEGGEYVVEEILDKRKEGGVWKYHIKWLGWKSDSNTWEPKDNLKCEDLLKKFEEEWAEKEKSTNDRRGSDETVMLARTKKAPSVEKTEKPEKKKADKPEKRERERSSTPASTSGSIPILERKVKKREKPESEKPAEEDKEDKDKDTGFEDLDILDECPSGRVPQTLVGVVPISNVLVYCVEWKPPEEETEEFNEPVSLVRSEAFSTKFPAMVIKFYESHIIWAKDPKDEAKQFKDSELSQNSKSESKKSNHSDDDDSDDEPLVKKLSKKNASDSDSEGSDSRNSKENYP